MPTVERPTAVVAVLRRVGIAHVVDDQRQRGAVAELVRHAAVVLGVRAIAAAAVALGQAAVAVGAEVGGPRADRPGQAGVDLAAPVAGFQRVEGVAQVDARVVGELLVVVLDHQGVGDVGGEVAEAARAPAHVGLHVDAVGALGGGVDRVDQHAPHLVGLHRR
ncbi:hypothetical protein CATMIT_01932, partial [Catenibacterium mitsuokai DSM 15897]